MSQETQQFLLALLLALFLPSRQASEELQDKECMMKTEFVLQRLTKCGMSNCAGAATMEVELLKNVVKESISALFKQRNEETKSQLDLLTSQLEKVDKTLVKLEKKVQQMAETTEPPGDCREIQKLKSSNADRFFKVSETIYYVELTYVTWYRARDWCAERGMQLASLKTLSQLQPVHIELKNRGFENNYFWLSGSDMGRKGGQFQWADGTPVNNSTWFPGQPDDFGIGKETCVFLATGYKLWDNSCIDIRGILCEVPTALSSCVSDIRNV